LNLSRPLHWKYKSLAMVRGRAFCRARLLATKSWVSKIIEVALHPQAIAQEIAKLDALAAGSAYCSLQRRQATLERICADALRLGTASICARGHGEFLIDQQGALLSRSQST